MPTIYLLIRGKVQGVFYRASAKKAAEKLGVAGWVRNTMEGDVEAIASGSEEQLQQFIHWCYKGPSKAIVTDVLKKELPEEAFDGFTVRR